MATDHDHHLSSHGDDGPGELNHETTDISLEGVGKLTIAFAVILCVVSGVIYGSYRLLDARAVQADMTRMRALDAGRAAATPERPGLTNAPNTLDRVGRLPAGPKILTNEPAWLADIKSAQTQALTTYGWVNKEAGTVRLPIERAKQLLIERGLPVTQPPATEPAPADATAPTDAPAAAPVS